MCLTSLRCVTFRVTNCRLAYTYLYGIVVQHQTTTQELSLVGYTNEEMQVPFIKEITVCNSNKINAKG